MSLLRLLSTMDRNRFQSTVTSMIPAGEVGHRIEKLGIAVRSLSLTRGTFPPSALWRLSQDLRRNRPDILMTWLYHSDLLGILAAKIARVPVTVWNIRASDMDMSRYGKLSGLTLRTCSLLSSWPNAIVANSESGKAFHARLGYRPRRWEVIRNGVDSNLFRPDDAARERLRSEYAIGPGDTVVGVIARFDPMKDHENLLAAAQIVVRAAPECRFFLAGKGVSDDNPFFAQSLSGTLLSGRIRLFGERDDIPQFMAALDIACSPSCSEAFPNALAEAMSCGIPCVATNVGDSSDILAETGIVVPPRDAEALAQGLLKLIAMDKSGRASLGGAARRRICERFGLERFVRNYESFIADAVKR